MQKKHSNKWTHNEKVTNWIFFSWWLLRKEEKTGIFFLINAGIEPAGRLLKQPLIFEWLSEEEGNHLLLANGPY
jgi:hypothetical protein